MPLFAHFLKSGIIPPMLNLTYLLFVLSLFSSPVFSQDDYVDDKTKLRQIVSVKQGMDSLRSQIKTRETALKKERSEDNKALIEEELVLLNGYLKKAEYAFDALASGVSFVGDDDKTQDKRGLVQDVEEVLAPLVQNIKRMSETPRKIERLRTDIAKLEEQLTLFNDGEQNIDELMNSKTFTDDDVLGELSDTKIRLSILKDSIKLRLNIAQSQLSELLKGSKSILRSSTEVVEEFFKTKGLNLLIALLATLLTFGVLFALKRSLLRPLFGKEKLNSFGKPLIALYEVVAVVLSSIVGLTSLLVLNDWFLFTLFIIIIGALMWSFKHLIVDIMGAVRIVMDMGTVREGQRVMMNGIPWRVKRIGIRTSLVNEALEGGHINISMGKLKELVSRHVVGDEPWFPTKKDDFVILADGTYGQVVVQTPEQVILLVDGVTRKFYSTVDFLAQRPQNLSDGFIVTGMVSLDYSYQKKMVGIIETFQEGLQEKLMKDNIKVEFSDAGMDSLNLIATVGYEGSMAKNYLAVKRELQHFLVDICTKSKLEIPFRQLTIHTED